MGSVTGTAESRVHRTDEITDAQVKYIAPSKLINKEEPTAQLERVSHNPAILSSEDP